MIRNVILIGSPQSARQLLPPGCPLLGATNLIGPFPGVADALRFLQAGHGADAIIFAAMRPPDPTAVAHAFLHHAPKAALIYLPAIAPQPAAQPEELLYIRAFGSFDVFCGSRAVDFPNSKSKELLALCVHRQGGYVTMEEVCDLLWPDKVYDQRVKRLYRKAVSCLHKTLGLYCPSPVFENLRGKCHVIPDAFRCDYYTYLRGPADTPPPDITYMRQYDWAEETCARLYFAALRHGPPAK